MLEIVSLNQTGIRVVKVGDVFDAEVTDISSHGQGVIRHPEGLTCFVSGLWISETGRFTVTELKRGFGQAKCIELTRAHASRTSAPCKHHGFAVSDCGGCPWMFVDYPAQLVEKQRRVSAAIARINERWQACVRDIIASPKELGYRNRIQLKTDGRSLGFVASKSHNLVDVESCPVLDAKLEEALAHLRNSLPNTGWQSKRGQMNRPNKRRHSDRGQKPKWTTVDIDNETSAGDALINQRLPFKQANDLQNEQMRRWLCRELEALTIKRETDSLKIVELFCGSGNFTEVLSNIASAHVVAAEANSDAIAKIRDKNWPSVSAHVVDLFDKAAFKNFMCKCRNMDVLVLDPPRDGMKEKEGLFVKSTRPRHILYISCDLATFCRDLNEFKGQGYKLESLQPIDLFPQTPHVELLAKISLKTK